MRCKHSDAGAGSAQGASILPNGGIIGRRTADDDAAWQCGSTRRRGGAAATPVGTHMGTWAGGSDVGLWSPSWPAPGDLISLGRRRRPLTPPPQLADHIPRQTMVTAVSRDAGAARGEATEVGKRPEHGEGGNSRVPCMGGTGMGWRGSLRRSEHNMSDISRTQ